MAEDIKELIEEKGKAWSEYQKANDERIKALEAKTGVPAELTEKIDKINAELTRLSAEIKQIEIRANRPPAGNTEKDAYDSEHKAAFVDYMRTGEIAPILKTRTVQVEGKSVNTLNDTQGGYVVHNEVSNIIERVALATTAMRRIATVTTIGAKAFEEVVVTAGMTASWVGETSSPSETTAPTLAKITITPGTEYVMPYATQAMLEDADFDIAAWLGEEAGYSFIAAEGAAFITGSGVNSPKGIASYTPVANASYAWGSTGYIASGKSGAFADSSPANKLFDLYHALKPMYRSNATWLMLDATLNTVRQFQDGMGNYLWQPGLQLGQPDLLLGKPVETDDNVATVASDSYSIFFADFKRAYRIVDRRGILVLRDPFSSKPYTLFYTTKRVGGDIKNFEAIKVMKFAAS